MKSRPLATALAILLTVTLIAPSAFLVVPQRAQAQLATFEMNPALVGTQTAAAIKTSVETTISAIKNVLIEVHAATSAAADYAQWTNTFILQPLAFVLSGNLMKMLTAGVIAFVIGKANGTGAPQFVVDVMRTMQTVGDSQALAYLNSFGRNSNSPFSYSISSALRTNYLQKTSLAGFWAANMSTLARSSPNVNAFLAGRWTQGGGIAAWFALTTQTQNNPYTLFQASQSQMATLVGAGVGGVTGARAAQLSWGQGFMSWCGATDAATQTQNSAATEYQQCQASGGSGADCQFAFENAGGTMPTSVGINPGDACTTKDGTPGTTKTPGSLIKSTLDKVLGGQQDQIVRMGNIGPQINQILGNIATVMQTVQFASQILGGPGSGGLFGVDAPSGSNSTSRLIQYQATPSLGVTNADVYKNAATLAPSGSDMSSRVTQYQSAWNVIGAAANAASTSVVALVNYCNAQKGVQDASPTAITAQVSAAQTALATEIAPVLARAATAAATIAAANAMIQKIQNESNSGTDAAGSAYAADTQTLQTMPPTVSDVANIQQDAQSSRMETTSPDGSTIVSSSAIASPTGSLTVSGGSLVDQMSLIGTNATALKAVCAPSSAPIDFSAG